MLKVAPELYRVMYQEHPWDALDIEIDRQIRAGQKIDKDALKRVFLRQAAV